MEREINAGYHIFWFGGSYAAGYCPSAPDPFVVWDVDHRGDYNFGRYRSTLEETCKTVYELPFHSNTTVTPKEAFDKYMAETFKALDVAEDVLGEIKEHARTRLIIGASDVNKYADIGDINRNHTNYGIVTQCTATLVRAGEEPVVPVYETEGVLRIPSVIIGGKLIELEHSNEHVEIPRTDINPETPEPNHESDFGMDIGMPMM